MRQKRTARRPDAECAVELSKRRAWFADADSGEQDSPEPQDSPDNDDLVSKIAKDPNRTAAEIRNLRDEARRNRLALKELSALQEQLKKADEMKLEEQKEFQKLAEQRAAKIAELEKMIAERDAQALRVRIAEEVGLPSALAARLVGDDEAALKADAEAIKATLNLGSQQPGKKNTTTAVPTGTPAGETDEQRRARLFGGGGNWLKGGGYRPLNED